MSHQFKEKFRRAFFAPVLVGLLMWTGAVCAQTTAFTYQGVLNDGAAPANNNYDMQFKLFDVITGGAQVGDTITKPTVDVTNGVFTVQLDFGGNAFTGSARFLEMGVRPAGNTGAYSVSPRTQITSTPYAIRALNSTQLNGVPATQFVQADNNGNVGVGTTTPGTKLDVRGNVTLESGASPVLYTGTANTDQNRYLQLINSSSAPSASGLKAGGLLVADSYSYANPGKNNLVVKGSIGVGTPSPLYRLEVNTPLGSYGFVHSTPSSNFVTPIRVGSFAGTGPGGAVGGWLGTLTNDQLHLFVNGGGPSMTISTDGNVGIGTNTPTSKLDIAAQDGVRIRGFQPFLTLTDSNSGNARGRIGSGNGDLSFYPEGSFASGVAAMTLKNGGNVGIGTGTPAHRLSVAGGPTWTSNGWKGALSFDNVSAMGWQGNAAGWHFGIGQTDGGLYFFRTSSSPGSGAAPANYDMVLGDGGNLTLNVDATQQRDKSGFVKAMIYVNEDGTIARCFNSQAAGPNGQCGFSVTLRSLGLYEVNFGFRVEDRFFSVTPVADSSTNSTSVFIQPASSNSLNVYITASNRNGSFTNAPFMAIVY